MVRRRLYLSSTIALLCLLLLTPSASLFAQAADPNVAPVAAAAAGSQLVVLEINRNVTKADRGFPSNLPPRPEANGNWRTPINYAEGTMYYRVEIRRQPTPQNMRLQFCAWQDNFRGETCGAIKSVSGQSGTVVTWSQSVSSMWKKGNRGVDWTRPRQRYSIAIKNTAGKAISDYSGWRWNGENPERWYPLDMRFTVVVVAKGSQFSGWQNYGGNVSDNALITDASNATIDAAGVASNSADGNNLDFGSGLDSSQWAAESATDAVEIEEDAETLSDEARDNKLYLPMVGS